MWRRQNLRRIGAELGGTEHAHGANVRHDVLLDRYVWVPRVLVAHSGTNQTQQQPRVGIRGLMEPRHGTHSHHREGRHSGTLRSARLLSLRADLLRAPDGVCGSVFNDNAAVEVQCERDRREATLGTRLAVRERAATVGVDAAPVDVGHLEKQQESDAVQIKRLVADNREARTQGTRIAGEAKLTRPGAARRAHGVIALSAVVTPDTDVYAAAVAGSTAAFTGQ